jgi:hypothetical protein
VEVEIAGVGTFRANGLSRIGWDIEVIAVPTDAGRTHKESGVLTYTDVAMLGLVGTQSDARALAAWIEDDPTPRDVAVTLQGISGERVLVRLDGAQPMGGEPAVILTEEGWMVGGVVLGHIQSMSLEEHQIWGIVPPCAAPGQDVEIEGVSTAPCYPLGRLVVPAPETSDGLRLPAVRDGQSLYLWASGARDDVEREGCVGCGASGRRNLSVITRDAERREIGRINIFEGWVARFSFFDPEARYGHDFLFTLDVVDDRVEDAN